MITSAYTVKGMTCGHCVAAVKDELGSIAGVQSVEVDLESGVVVVASEQDVPLDAVRAAIDEAGYELET